MEIKCLFDELVDPRSLKPSPKNRNTHSAEQIARLAQILGYQGQRAPVVVSKRSGCIAKGHGTTLASIEAGSDNIAVVYQDFESDEVEYAFLVSDNGISEWAVLDLAGINADLADLGPEFDIEMLGIKDFVLDLSEKSGLDEKQDQEKASKHLLEVEFSSEQDMLGVYNNLLERGFIVRCK